MSDLNETRITFEIFECKLALTQRFVEQLLEPLCLNLSVLQQHFLLLNQPQFTAERRRSTEMTLFKLNWKFENFLFIIY